jgi:hypothetical protein
LCRARTLSQPRRLLTEPAACSSPRSRRSLYHANILIAETGEKAQQALAQYPREAVFPLKDGIATTLLELDQRNVAGEPTAMILRPERPRRNSICPEPPTPGRYDAHWRRLCEQ